MFNNAAVVSEEVLLAFCDLTEISIAGCSTSRVSVRLVRNRRGVTISEILHDSPDVVRWIHFPHWTGVRQSHAKAHRPQK